MEQPLCIDLDQPRMEGFRKFISSWLLRSNGFTLVIDPGPVSTIPRLVEELRRRGVDRVDYILLTHIHIDHAGGTGVLLTEFPEARVICHPDGIRHLAAPEKLWQGSRKVLGELAEVYGEIVAVPEEKISFQEEVGETGVRAFLTPGHAQHHVSYLVRDLLVAGEVAGVRCDLPEGELFMRPATPPRFLLPVALESLDRVIALAPRRMIFAHHGMVENGVGHLRRARRQLLLWLQGVALMEGEGSQREEALRQWLLQHDPLYAGFRSLPEDIQVRERYFLGNTLRGMMEYVDALPPEERQRLAKGTGA